ncbi:DUF4189 domain-containing protein [Xanthomonas albilineans]|uniref:DUF4189 domain-containing protein n=1 Tax=Xanthomonas albilineans TaxID=29447 RepID=UPI0009BAD04B|nr:DUF4189 domain-containing protein [Xanthomonas albilineans]
MKRATYMATLILIFSMDASAEGGCPPGQLPAQSNGSMASCVPIPRDNPEPQQPRPTGKWLKTWGALADDGAENVGVSSGKLSKAEAENDAIKQCESSSKYNCHVISTYENQCVAVAEPNHLGHIIRSIASGPSLDETSNRAIADCQKKNSVSECKIGYADCTKQIFQRF